MGRTQAPHEVPFDIRPRSVGTALSHVDHDVDAEPRQSSGVPTKQLAHPPPRTITNDGATDASRGRNSKAALFPVPREREDDDEASADLNTLPVDRLELAPPAQRGDQHAAVKRLAAGAPCAAARRARADPPGSACAHGSHGSSSGDGCSVETSASCLTPSVPEPRAIGNEELTLVRPPGQAAHSFQLSTR